MNMSGEKKHRDFDQLLSGYLSGELSPEELTWFLEELGKDSGKQAALDDYRLIWDSAAPQHGYDLDEEWDLLKGKLSGFSSGSETSVRGAVRSLAYYSYRIAAVMVLGFMLTFAWVYVSRIAGMEKIVADNEAVEVVLDDGTAVIVNRHSRLRYSRKFDQHERKVYLSGEAWFDVARDTTIPFVIDVGAALVEVLGTSFNVNAYKENSTVEITVKSGLVALSAKKDQKNLIVMKAGSGGSYDKIQRELKLVPSPDPNNISWRTRELFFEGTSLKEVIGLLSRVYDVHIVIINQELEDCPLTVTFRNQSLDAILKVLESTLDLKVSRAGDEIRLDGEGCVE